MYRKIMASPVKSGSSLLLNVQRFSAKSPRLLSPTENKHLFTPTRPKVNINKTPNHNNNNNNIKKSAVEIKITDDRSYKDTLLIDTPHKLNLLNHGLNKFDLLFSLGKGSFGTVIKGEYKGKTVAAKLIKSESNQIKESNAQNLVHDNIIRIFDVIISEKYALVIMEYYKNSKNLQSVVDDASIVLSRESIIKYGRDVANGLGYCHNNDVLHLDIKPKNIILCEDGICKICDFGNCTKESSGVQEFKFQGTVAYTAPEILRGKTPSPKSDIYSLGMLIWQLLSRKSPYEFADSEVVIYKVVKFNFRPSLDLQDESLSNLCRLCWDGNPNQRPTAEKVSFILNNM